MSTPPIANIRIHVDPTNPGQFFACCGLLELANRVSKGAEGWFDGTTFNIRCTCMLRDLLALTQSIQIAGQGIDEAINANEQEDDESVNDLVDPIRIISPINLILEWWSDKSIKTWAGSMDVKCIFRAMCAAIDPDCPDPLNHGQVVYDPIVDTHKIGARRNNPKRKKREPFYFDSRRGSNATSVDIGFSPNKLDMLTIAYPAVEALCLIGLQRCRPTPVKKANISSNLLNYCSWSNPCHISLLPAAIAGILKDPAAISYQFENANRTDKLRAFLPAKTNPITS